jgi:hypothetical protein
VLDIHGTNSDSLERRQIAAVLAFCFDNDGEVRGEATERLPKELITELRQFARGQLNENDLTKLSAKIALNAAAIEACAREITDFWERGGDPRQGDGPVGRRSS